MSSKAAELSEIEGAAEKPIAAAGGEKEGKKQGSEVADTKLTEATSGADDDVAAKVNKAAEEPVADANLIAAALGADDKVEVDNIFTTVAESEQVAVTLADEEKIFTTVEEDADEDLLFPADAGMPGAESTMANWAMRKVYAATCRLLNLGIVEEDPERPNFHVSYALAKSRRNEQSVRKLLEFDEYEKELKVLHVGEPPQWVNVVDADGNPVVNRHAGEYIPYSFSEVIPFFHFPGQRVLCPGQFKKQSSVLDECGMGVVAYFKIIKCMAVIFGLMSLIVLPSIIMFSQANSVPPRELFYSAMVNSQTVLATSTLANLAGTM